MQWYYYALLRAHKNLNLVVPPKCLMNPFTPTLFSIPSSLLCSFLYNIQWKSISKRWKCLESYTMSIINRFVIILFLVVHWLKLLTKSVFSGVSKFRREIVLVSLRHQFLENAHLFIFKTCIHIHQCIDIHEEFSLKYIKVTEY